MKAIDLKLHQLKLAKEKILPTKPDPMRWVGVIGEEPPEEAVWKNGGWYI